MIDKIIHQIWVGEYNIPSREKRISQEIKEKHPDYQYYLWTDDNIPTIPIRLKNMYDVMYKRKDYTFCADMIRWLVVYEYGGWYLDIDWEYISNLNNLNLKDRDGIVFGHWGRGWRHIDYTLTNNVFAFKKNHPIVKYVIEEMKSDLDYCNPTYDPAFTGLSIKKYMELDYYFTDQLWEYHRIMKETLNIHNIEYGDYNTFQKEILKHHALFSWDNENKLKFQNGEIK